MSKLFAAAAVFVLLAQQGWAQQGWAQQGWAQQGWAQQVLAQGAPNTPAAPAMPGVVATTNNPNLAVATLRLENGQRLSKVIGSGVYNEGGDKVGAVDDLIMTADNKVSMAIISVGGFLGLGSKLVAVPWGQLRQDGEKTVLAGASKDSLNAMPGFQY